MGSLLGLIFAVALTVGFYAWRGHDLWRSKPEALLFSGLYCFALLLAERFGARTYPGIYFPDSVGLNILFNRATFGIGYLAVLVAAAADWLLILWPGVGAVAKATKWLALWVATTLAAYGFTWAAIMQRLPA